MFAIRANRMFKVGDYIRCDKMQVEGVVLEAGPSASSQAGMMIVKLYCIKDVTYPLNVHQRIKLNIMPDRWKVTSENTI